MIVTAVPPVTGPVGGATSTTTGPTGGSWEYANSPGTVDVPAGVVTDTGRPSACAGVTAEIDLSELTEHHQVAVSVTTAAGTSTVPSLFLYAL